MCIFFNENVWIPIQISLKFVPKGPINNIPALVRIMALRRPGDKPWLNYRRIYASLGLNELIADSLRLLLFFTDLLRCDCGCKTIMGPSRELIQFGWNEFQIIVIKIQYNAVNHKIL